MMLKCSVFIIINLIILLARNISSEANPSPFQPKYSKFIFLNSSDHESTFKRLVKYKGIKRKR